MSELKKYSFQIKLNGIVKFDNVKFDKTFSETIECKTFEYLEEDKVIELDEFTIYDLELKDIARHTFKQWLIQHSNGIVDVIDNKDPNFPMCSGKITDNLTIIAQYEEDRSCEFSIAAQMESGTPLEISVQPASDELPDVSPTTGKTYNGTRFNIYIDQVKLNMSLYHIIQLHETTNMMKKER